MKTQEIINTQDIIDSRDVIARIDYLRSELDSLSFDVFEAEDESELDEARKALADWLGIEAEDLPATAKSLEGSALKEYASSGEAEELFALESLADEASGYASDWRHGETLIRDSYFRDYAEQMAEDIGAIPSDAKWPCNCIDWVQAAQELQQDYTQVDFDGVAYWIR